jgi:hypothetical protein
MAAARTHRAGVWARRRSGCCLLLFHVPLFDCENLQNLKDLTIWINLLTRHGYSSTTRCVQLSISLKSIYSAQNNRSLPCSGSRWIRPWSRQHHRNPLCPSTSKSAPCRPTVSVQSTKIRHQCQFGFFTLGSQVVKNTARSQLLSA